MNTHLRLLAGTDDTSSSQDHETLKKWTSTISTISVFTIFEQVGAVWLDASLTATDNAKDVRSRDCKQRYDSYCVYQILTANSHWSDCIKINLTGTDNLIINRTLWQLHYCLLLTSFICSHSAMEKLEQCGKSVQS